jgi:acyl carrier protein
MSEIQDRVMKVLRTKCARQGDIPMNTKLGELGMDSLDVVAFETAIEDEFGVAIQPDWEGWHTIEDVMAFVRNELMPSAR